MKVLLVDDDPLMLRMFGRALEQAGHTLVTAENGEAALTAAEDARPDIVLMDVMMPKMNGIEALKAMKANEQIKGMPIIMLSAYDDPELMQQALDAGAARYLAKNMLEPKQVAELVQKTYDEATPAKH